MNPPSAGETTTPAEAEAWRLFLALTIPSEVRRQLHAARSRLQQSLPPSAVRWVHPEQVHLTLRFLGEVPADRVPALETALRPVGAAFRPLGLRARGIGFFPPHRPPRVIWAGVEEPTGELARLKAAVDEAAAAFTTEQPETGFSAHLTLGRVKHLPPHDARALLQAAAALTQAEFGTWTAERLELFRSVLSPTGPTYTCLAQVPLQAPV